MQVKVNVVDYGIGNLFSVLRSLERAGASPELVTDAKQVAQAERLILPGVGAFADCMQALRAGGLSDGVQAFIETGRPFLGLCVGMQMLLTESEEFGSTYGLGVIPGRVCRLPERSRTGLSLKVPHIGWSALKKNSADWNQTLLHSIKPSESAVYFVHSFEARPENPAHVLAHCDYEGHPVTAAVRREQIFGTQFHPEKSGPVGLQILRDFLRF